MLSEQNNIDQIRQIIFGEQIQKYEKKFDELLATIEKNANKQKKKSLISVVHWPKPLILSNSHRTN